MPIFDISSRIGLQENDREHNTERIQPMIPLLSERADEEISQELPLKEKSSWFSSLAARFLFFLLLVADLIWGMYALVLSLYAFLGIGLTLGRRSHFLQMKEKGWKS